MADLSMFSVSTKVGERRSGTHGLGYNTRHLLTQEEKQKRRSKWESNKNQKAAENRERGQAKMSKSR